MSRNKKEPERFVCKHCGDEFFRVVTNTDIKNGRKFNCCSVSCSNRYRARPLVPCPVCGTLFKDKFQGGGKRKKHCSRKCASEARKGSIPHNKTPQYILDVIKERFPDEGTEKLALEFGKTETSIRVLASRMGITRSKKALRKLYDGYRERMKANNPMYSQETRDKVSDYWKTHPEELEQSVGRLLAGQAARGKHNPSGLECKLWGILDSFDIEYEKQFLIKSKFVVDIKIGNLIIQADGDYWHGHKRLEPLTDRQVAQQKRDKSHDKYLLTCGYGVERIWEADMCSELVKSILLKYGIIA